MTVRLLVIVQTWWDVTIISRTPGNLHISYLGCATFNDLELKGRLVKRLIITSCAGVFRPNEPLQQLRRVSQFGPWTPPGKHPVSGWRATTPSERHCSSSTSLQSLFPPPYWCSLLAAQCCLGQHDRNSGPILWLFQHVVCFGLYVSCHVTRAWPILDFWGQILKLGSLKKTKNLKFLYIHTQNEWEDWFYLNETLSTLLKINYSFKCSQENRVV